MRLNLILQLIWTIKTTIQILRALRGRPPPSTKMKRKVVWNEKVRLNRKSLKLFVKLLISQRTMNTWENLKIFMIANYLIFKVRKALLMFSIKFAIFMKNKKLGIKQKMRSFKVSNSWGWMKMKKCKTSSKACVKKKHR